MSSDAKSKRANSYYLRRLENESPEIYRDLLAGKFRSPAEAFPKAGLKRPRSRLAELKNAWKKSTPTTQQEFMLWLDAMSPAPRPLASLASSPALAPASAASTGKSEPLGKEVKAQIESILSARSISSGRAMEEMGFSALNSSLGMALHRGTRVQPELVRALRKWLADNLPDGHLID